MTLDAGNDFIFLFHFEGDGQDNPRITSEIVGDTLVVNLLDFANMLGTTWASDVGQLNGRDVRVALYVKAIRGGDVLSRFVHVSVLLGDMAK